MTSPGLFAVELGGRCLEIFVLLLSFQISLATLLLLGETILDLESVGQEQVFTTSGACLLTGCRACLLLGCLGLP